MSFRQILRANAGRYLFSCGVSGFEDGELVVYDRRFDYFAFQVVADEQRAGFFDPEAEIEWERVGEEKKPEIQNES